MATPEKYFEINHEELLAYEQSRKYYRDIKNVIDTVEIEGEAKGRHEGLVEGRQEEGLKIARNALRENMPLDFVTTQPLRRVSGG